MGNNWNMVGKYQSYPDVTGKRQAEGGRRMRGEKRKSHSEAPLVTIITVCFNSSTTIQQTIRSVRNQSYKNIEYLIVDGNSSDGTLEIIFRNEDVIDYFVSEPDQGLYYAMNKGLELAQGDYILLLNSDDWYENDAVEKLVAAKNYSGCDFVAALARYVDEERARSEVLRSMPFDDSVYFRMPLRHETMLIPASLYERVGSYDTDYKIIADRDFTARLFDAGATYYEVPESLLNFRISGVSNTNIALLNYEKNKLVEKNFPFLSDQECQKLNDPQTASAEVFAEIANNHLDQPKFVKACRALLNDRRDHGGKRWQSDAIDTIGAADPLNWPKVSVILPFYNAENTIRASLESVLSQTLQDFEIVCVNDCPSDGSENIVEEYSLNDSRVKHIKNPQNIGLGASRNAGIRAAKGRYIFHLDPDDTLPSHALELLYETAMKHGSEMVKGAYKAGQRLHQQINKNDTVKYPCGVKKNIIANTALNYTPRLLHTTEGHWSSLYEANFARRVPYPTDLKMGQDSIFIVNAIVRARKITLLPEIVYHYKDNPNSAMNRFNARKFFDALEWRRRAWHILKDQNKLELAERLLFSYWSPTFFESLDNILTLEECDMFYNRLGTIFHMAGYPGTTPPSDSNLRSRFDTIVATYEKQKKIKPSFSSSEKSTILKIATLVTQDHGGAGLGSQRRVEALRNIAGVDAQIFCIFKKLNKNYTHQVCLKKYQNFKDLHSAWRSAAVLTRQEHPALMANEMFSKTGSIVDFRENRAVFDHADIVHLHWVSGFIDYAHLGETLHNKPVAWTLADMNAFTGGCHYSEGCEEYRNECRKCPLLGGASDLAYQAWKTKRQAYAELKHLHIICPSQWLADCAQKSSLLGDRPIHVIPNAFPVNRFTPTNRTVARLRLGLPLDRKLILFGADSLGNKRKGGDILVESIRHLRANGIIDNLEGLFFGASKLDLGLKAHHMGQVSDEKKMSLIYSAADVFAFPSREDNAPLTVVESMLSGTPVVGFPVGNVPVLIDHKINGYIAQYEDSTDFAKGLAWALRDTPPLESLRQGLRACCKARTHNDPDIAVARHMDLYRRMLQ